MALETLSSSELLNFIMYDSSISAARPLVSCNNNSNINDSSDTSPQENIGMSCSSEDPRLSHQPPAPDTAVQGRKKRRRRPKVCKNKEEAETQRMTHIAVERNRRKQMNEHLAVLRSLMPESYVQRGDQASIVGGAIEFVKELEHMLQSLEAKNFALLQQQQNQEHDNKAQVFSTSTTTSTSSNSPCAQFFAYPQFSCSSATHNNNNNSKYTSSSQISKAAIADIEVTLIETHANIRILSRRRMRQLSRIVASFHSVFLTILHLNVTSFDSLVLYSISAKVEEGCQLNSADDIAGAVHNMLRIIEEEAFLCC